MSYQYVALGKGNSTGAQVNQRATVRYQCAPATSGRVIPENDQEYLRAWILDLSIQGIGLLLQRPIKAETVLVLQLKSQSSNKTYEFSARVAHATSLPGGDWLIGCKFLTPISHEDLDALL